MRQKAFAVRHPDAAQHQVIAITERALIVYAGDFLHIRTPHQHPVRDGVKVTVVASRDQILPHEDSDAAAVLEELWEQRGVVLVKNARAESVTCTDDGVLVTMTDGRTVEASHALMTVGSVPNTGGLGLERVGIELGQGNYLTVDRVSRTSVPGIYAAGDIARFVLPERRSKRSFPRAVKIKMSNYPRKRPLAEAV